jgi:hypothetical protein
LCPTDGGFPEYSLLARWMERGRDSEIDFDFLVRKKMVLILLRVLIPEWINEIIIERIIVLVRGKGVTYECSSV